MHNHDFIKPRLISLNVRRLRPKTRGSVLHSQSPGRKEHCSQGLFTAIMTELKKYAEFQSETRYGYYPGGFYRMGKETEKQRKEEKGTEARVINTTNSWLEDTFPRPLINDGGATPLRSPAVANRWKFLGDRTGKAGGKSARGGISDKAINFMKKKGASCRLHSDLHQHRPSKLFGFTAPLLSVSRPKTASTRPFSSSNPVVRGEKLHPQALSSKFLPTSQGNFFSAKKSDSVTVIDVLIPTPKFRPGGVEATGDNHQQETKGHQKALSQGNQEMSWSEGANLSSGKDGNQTDFFAENFNMGEPTLTDISIVSQKQKLETRKKDGKLQGNEARFRRFSRPPH